MRFLFRMRYAIAYEIYIDEVIYIQLMQKLKETPLMNTSNEYLFWKQMMNIGFSNAFGNTSFGNK